MSKRYIVGFDFEKIDKAYYDVVIIGSGIAGLYTALNLSDGLCVCILNKDRITDNNSNLAQGGIVAGTYNDEDRNLHVQDTMKAGSFYNDIEAVEILAEEAAANIKKLIELGAVFDADSDGNLLVTREGGHSSRRILHSKDQTGKEIIRALSKAVLSKDYIHVRENTVAIDIITRQGDAKGVIVEGNDGLLAILAKSIVVATGGIGQVYMNTTNALVSTGDGIAMAYRAGALVIDMEFVQFHPTAFYSKTDRNRFLISEAVRGEGAVLRNRSGVAFMADYHELGDLAPRDIVASAIISEMKREKSPYVYLDMSQEDEIYVKNRFPHIHEQCLNRGIDMTKEYIPVCPVQHYIMGGIKTDYRGRTNISHLYACGEVASVRVHGANRLASNSLLEGLVYGKRVADCINRNSINSDGNYPIDYNLAVDTIVEDAKFKSKIECAHSSRDVSLASQVSHISDYEYILNVIRTIMSQHVFVIRYEEELQEAHRRILAIIADLKNDEGKESRAYYECVNVATIASLIISAALGRKKTLGSHIIRNKEEDEGVKLDYCR